MPAPQHHVTPASTNYILRAGGTSGTSVRLAGLMLIAIMPPTARATAPPPYVQPAGFINAERWTDGEAKPVQRLPANAKGALFLHRIHADTTRLRITGDDVLLTELPHPPVVTEFFIQEDGGRPTHSAPLERLPIDPRLGDLPTARYWLASGKKATSELKRCTSKRSVEACLGLSASTLKSPEKLQLALSARLRDVTSAVRQAEGLFRVAPTGGFKPGRSYAIRFKRDNMPGMLHPDEIHITVGTEVLVPAASGFQLVSHGPMQQLPINGSPAWTQTLKFTVPPSYERYRPHLLYVVKQFETPDRYEAAHWGRNPLAWPIYWGSALPRGLERFSAPGLGPGMQTSIGVSGYIAMLEVEDAVHRTPHLIVEFKLPDVRARTAPRTGH